MHYSNVARLWKQLGFGTNLAFAASLALYLVVNVWHRQAPSPFGDYVYFFGYWNIFFALGQLLHSLPGQIVAEGGRQS